MTKTNEATKIINFIHRANRTNYNGPEARESDICSFIENEIGRLLTEKDKEREGAVAGERERIINILPRLEEITAWRELGEATYAIRSAVEALTQTNNKQT